MLLVLVAHVRIHVAEQSALHLLIESWQTLLHVLRVEQLALIKEFLEEDKKLVLSVLELL